MRKTILSLTLFLLASAASGDVSRQDGRIILTYDFNEATVFQRCVGFGYSRHECRSVPTACNICSNSDTGVQCEAKIDNATDEQLGASLPTVSRIISGDLRDVCTGNETDAECEAKVTADAGAIGLAKGHCSVADPENITAEEWIVCEKRAAERGLVPGPLVDEHEVIVEGETVMVGDLPHFFGCISFIHEKVGRPNGQARDAGIVSMSMAEKPAADLSDDDP